MQHQPIALFRTHLLPFYQSVHGWIGLQDISCLVRRGTGYGGEGGRRRTQTGPDGVHDVVVGIAPFKVGDVVVQLVSVEVVHLGETPRVGDKSCCH